MSSSELMRIAHPRVGGAIFFFLNKYKISSRYTKIWIIIRDNKNIKLVF